MRLQLFLMVLVLSLTGPALPGQSKRKDKQKAQREFRKAMERNAELSRAPGAPRVGMPGIDLSAEAVAGHAADAYGNADELARHTLLLLSEWELQDGQQLSASDFRKSLRSRVSAILKLTKEIRRNPYLEYVDSLDKAKDEPFKTLPAPVEPGAVLLEIDATAQQIRFQIVRFLDGTADPSQEKRFSFESMTKYLDGLARIALKVARPVSP